MRYFEYKALSNNGAEVKGVVEALDKLDAVGRVKSQYSVILDVREVRQKGDTGVFKSKRISFKSLYLMCRQFEIIMTGGLPLVQSLEIISNQVSDKGLQKILKEVAQDVASGGSLSTSFADRGPTLPVTFIESVRAGEESGKLEATFHRLSAYFDMQTKARQKVFSAMIYPALVIFVAVVVVGIIMIYAVPIFSRTFTAMGVDLPIFTRILITASNFMVNNFWFLVLLLLAMAFGIKTYAATERGRKRISHLTISMPVIGKVVQMSNSLQFSSTMAAISAAGLPMVRAVEITGRSIGNYVMGLEVEKAAISLESGMRLSDSLRGSQYLPSMLIEMLAVGEESGSLDKTLEVACDYYDNETTTATQRLLSILEPLTIVFLAGIVAVILLAVYMPMFSMYDSIGTM